MTPRIQYILWAATAFIGFTQGQYPDEEYCSVSCSQGQHTMCKYKPVSPNCQSVKSLMSQDGRMKILSLHNSFRNALAEGVLKKVPSSSNMRQLYWDLELEAIAERWALQCNASYQDECRNVNRFWVGQIMSKSNIISTNVNYYEALLTKLWFPEVENLNEAIISHYREEREVKHIAQILSAKTMRIGCADVLYSTAHEHRPVRVTICNYGPKVSTNDVIYRVGKACTECPQQTECRGDVGRYPHLCTELRHFDVVEPERNFDAVQREYDDDDIDTVEVESDLFQKKKNGYLRGSRKHSYFPRRWPMYQPSDYLEGGRALGGDNETAPETPKEPGKPNEPGNTEEPGKPDEPGKPNEPGNIEEPGKPNEPGNTTEPGRPKEPAKPREPANRQQSIPPSSSPPTTGSGTTQEPSCLRRAGILFYFIILIMTAVAV